MIFILAESGRKFWYEVKSGVFSKAKKKEN